MTGRLTGKVVLVSGATGIGAATAELAAREGARVFVTALEADAIGALAGRIRTAGGEADGCAGDLTQAGAAAEAVRRCVARFGRIDALFNVAGISGRKHGDGPLHECTEAGWDRTLDANVKTMFLLAREALKVMIDQPPGTGGLRGSILNMASTLAIAPEPDHFATHAYAASKGAVLGLTRSMAAYYAPRKIRVNAIAPSLVRTPMSLRAQQDPAILALMKTRHPLREDLIEAEDVAKAAVFLMSDEASCITGDVLTVDAGWGVS